MIFPAAQAARIRARGGPVLLVLAHDERPRLPGLLSHYRAMGIRNVVVIDNRSTDGTAAYLATQEGVERIAADGDFRAANFGMDWINTVRAALPPEIWSIYVDADEYLVYDGWPGVSLPAYLGGVLPSRNAVVGFMLDMYPRGTVASVPPDGDLLSAAACFDRDYRFRRRPAKPWRKSIPSIEFLGGPRIRLFSSLEREARTGWASYVVRGQIDRLLRIAPPRWRRRIIENFPATLPALKKTPITRGREVSYINSHDVRGARYHRRNCVLLHYKFTAEFAAKVEREIAREQHYRFGAEYILYKKFGLSDGRLRLHAEGASGTFRTADDLVHAGLIRDIGELLADSAGGPAR